MRKNRAKQRLKHSIPYFIVEGCTEENYIAVLKTIFRKSAKINNTNGGNAKGVMQKAKKIIKSKQKYPFEKLEDKIKPKYIKIKKTDYNGDIDIVQKISFKDGKIHFRDEKSTGMDLYKAEKGDLITSKINVHQGALALADRN